MQDVMDVMKALSDESRVRIVCALKDGELCVCQLIELLKLAPSTVSKHLSIMKTARIIESRKEGRWMYYRLSKKPRLSEAVELIDVLIRAAAGNRQIKSDGRKLASITKMGLEKLCSKQ